MRMRLRAPVFMMRMGRPPGSIEHLIEGGGAPATVDVIRFDEVSMETERDVGVEGVERALSMGGVRWVSIRGISDHSLLKWLGTRLAIHPLVIEDIANPETKCKFEDHGDFLLVISKIAHVTDDGVVVHHCPMLLFDGLVISLTDAEHDDLEVMERRVADPRSRLRRKGASYLWYALQDMMVDHLILGVKRVEDSIEMLEEAMIEDSNSKGVIDISSLKRKVLSMRKEAAPCRGAVLEMRRSESALIAEGMDIFLKDLYDHISYANDALDSARELLLDLHQLNLSIASNKMNDIMRVLTIVATIFIPLSFITGIYGMNFVGMDELGWEYGYIMSLSVMALIAGTMLLLFHRYGWLSR